MATIAESTTKTFNVVPGTRYTFGVAGTWDSMTGTLKWSDGTTDVSIQAFTADGAVEFVVPGSATQVKFVTGADGTNAGSLIIGLSKVLN
jgi:hypothetical protein